MRGSHHARLRIIPLLGLLAALLMPGAVALAPPAAAAPKADTAAAPVRIMPLGDSITGSPGCWRAVLWNRLRSAGYTDIDFVGTLGPQGCGQPHDGDNEGHGGELVTNVADQNLLPGRLAATLPDVVVMHFGTNDVWSAIAPDRILAAYTELVGQMRASNPDMRVLVAQLIPMNPESCTACAQRVVDFNARIPDWARATSTSRSPVTVVDQWTGFSTATDTYDGVHPNAAGDDKIAARWYPALAAVLDAGVPQDPEDPGDPGDPGEGEPSCAAVFRAVNVWQGGYQGEVTVTNTSAAPVAGWTVTVVPADGARLTQLWNGTPGTAADGTATVTNASWNGALAPGGSATFGFIASTSTTGTPSATVGCTARAAVPS
ncbi:GDSL-type esterase/lipase family protein [Streptomyces ipomoeae]|uniref:GDSL-type esterase/lipase family protein n=1 Tax=Streptomyces ipomoeae TaxID=103232 RepID=UPI0011464059|nr:GDSL-type esterase/lipase family protein [Streptomyces ipomoeae]MDX2933761.1 GDSL-type esterase/lipase family protein [Streptomyces ipomoeae]TQE25823.1 cellulose-binding protein [Streptomyces ipomoeae]